MHQRGLVAFLAGLLFIGVGSCTRGDPGFAIIGLDDIEDCVASASTTTNSFGLWDLNSGRGYLAGPILQSQLQSTNTDIGADPNFLRVEGLAVELLQADGATPLQFSNPAYVNPYTVRGTTTINPTSGGGNTSTGAIVVTLIPADYIEELLPLLGPSPNPADQVQIVVEMIPFGVTLGEVNVTGTNWLYPIQLCYDCLQDCATLTQNHPCIGGQDFVPYCLSLP